MRVWLPALLLALPVAAPAAPEQIDLRPGEPVPVGLHSVFQGLASLLGRWSYWQGERVVEIETVPADAQLALYYIRRNFQKRYESALAPVRVRLPKRVNTTSHDTLSIRVLAAGYTTAEHKYPVRDVPEKLSIRLAPLPNALIDIVHTYIAGRTTLSLHTTESPEFRISRSRDASSFVLALTKTADKLEPRPRIQGGPLRELEVTQVGEDILLRLSMDSTSLEYGIRDCKNVCPLRSVWAMISRCIDLRLSTMLQNGRISGPASDDSARWLRS